ncbi:TetR/AcrR family transcriptional regulator [Actinomyces timonensis]|uniref:TetR/AcrR family transcriptional regulator n=1 Tax=Actinomyces timonensis TaxID=1288391 RepID=UPI000318992F|nr:TetR family transcriptional regulator [Actinomyces timonensis]
MSPATTDRRSPGPRPGFERADAVDAALDLGIASFTLAQVAARLGVGAPALYREIDSRDDLLRACLDRLGASVDMTGLDGDWSDVLRTVADRLWDLLDAHPGLAGILLTLPWAHQSFAECVRAEIAALEATGLDRRKAVLAADFAGDTVIGTHAAVEGLRAAAPSSSWPPSALAGAMPEELKPGPEWAERGWLDLKLDVIIAGLNG